MIKVPLFAFTIISFFLYLFAPATAQAGETDFRLIYIGSLSGYVKLCG
ncbi:MAG: hypothetical protein J7L25_01540 [Deltaproteobacteria bacterium]|nr:hypothetical protein [Candidatus Tharpella aukensis]